MKDATESLRCQPPEFTRVQAAHQAPRLSQTSSGRPANSRPAPSPALQPLRDPTWASCPPARSLHPHSGAQPARDCCPRCRPPVAAALGRLPDAQVDRTASGDAGRADASPARAGSGPGRTRRRRRHQGPRDAPSRPLSRTPEPLPPAGLRVCLLLGHPRFSRADPEPPGTASRSTPPTQCPRVTATHLTPGPPRSQMSFPGLP